MDGLRDQCWHISRWIIVTDNRQALERWITIASDSFLFCLVVAWSNTSGWVVPMRHCQGACNSDANKDKRTWRCEDTVDDNLESNVTIACKVRGVLREYSQTTSETRDSGRPSCRNTMTVIQT